MSNMTNKLEVLQVLEEYEEKLDEELTKNSSEFLDQINHGFKVFLGGSTREFVKNLQQIMRKETIYMIRSLNVEFADLEMQLDEAEEIDIKPIVPDLYTHQSYLLNDPYENTNQKLDAKFERELTEAVDNLEDEQDMKFTPLEIKKLNRRKDQKVSLDIKDLFVLKDGGDYMESKVKTEATGAAQPNTFVYVCSEGNCDGIICMGRKLFVKHLMENHNLTEEECLSIAGKQRSRMKDVRKKLKPVKPVTCNDCDKVFKGVHCARALRKHRKIHYEPDEKCHNCDKTFRYKETLRVHQETVHEGKAREGICTLCGKTMSPRNLNNHMAVMHGYEEFPCEIEGCDKIFKSRISLRSHARFCDKIETCGDCDKTFKRKDSLNHHIQIVHEGKRLEEKSCEECSKVILLKNYNKHMAYAHGSDEHLPCEECGKTFRSKPALKTHAALCNNFEKCDECGKILGKGNLKYHMLAAHSSEDIKEHKCPYCPSSYIRQNQLKYHIDNKHFEAEKPFICQLCPKSFVVKSELALHVESHNDEREYECDQCQNAYKRKNHLYRHKRIAHDCTMTDQMIEKERKYMKSLRKKANTEMGLPVSTNEAELSTSLFSSDDPEL